MNPLSLEEFGLGLEAKFIVSVSVSKHHQSLGLEMSGLGLGLEQPY